MLSDAQRDAIAARLRQGRKTPAGAAGPRQPEPGDWFLTSKPAGTWAASAPRIFCFPYAGGSPRALLGWQARLGPHAEILPVCRPGREHRAAEPAPTMAELIDGSAAAVTAVTSADSRPFYLAGHSQGAVVAFEVCRRLAGAAGAAAAAAGTAGTAGAAGPRQFIASGCVAPSLMPTKRVTDIARLTGREFAEAVGFFGGLPAEVIADEETLSLVLPSVIADFSMGAGYRYQPGPPLAVPATLVIGRDDPHVGQPQVEPWGKEFASPPDVHWVDGGHFYFEPDPTAIIDVLLALVSSDQHAGQS